MNARLVFPNPACQLKPLSSDSYGLSLVYNKNAPNTWRYLLNAVCYKVCKSVLICYIGNTENTIVAFIFDLKNTTY